MPLLYTFLGLLLLLAITSLAWHLFEARWDRKLFSGDGSSARNLNVAEVTTLLESDTRIAVLDVRPVREFDRAHLPGALSFDASHPDFVANLRVRDKSQPHLIYCAGGYHSRQVCGLMKELGFQKIYHLHRGILSWRLRRRPVLK